MMKLKKILLENSPFIYLPILRGYKKLPAVYLRAGNLPNGASMNNILMRNENGVSVYLAWKDTRTKKYVLQSGSEQLLSTQQEILTRPWYEVTGKDTGNTGDDGEDLLEVGSIKIIKKISPDDIVFEQDPWMTLTGKELTDENTPDWK